MEGEVLAGEVRAELVVRDAGLSSDCKGFFI